MGRLFGTDGARGIANKELDCELAMNIGRAAAYVLTEKTTEKPKVLIGKDTRVSSNMLEMALAAGLCSVGADVVLVGFVPTPAIAYLVKDREADAGIMISASHNPCEYNGIKIFDCNGFKLPDALEEEIEALVLDDMSPVEFPVGGDVGSVFARYDYVDLYIDHLVRSVRADLTGMKIAIDCANGCASYTAEKFFKKLGADVHMMHDNPNGVNINARCGSTHMEDLIDYVNGHSVDLGLAFDGDSDRCLAVDENGQLVDGDKVIAICAKRMLDEGTLAKNTAVVTVMSNMGFFKFCEENGIACEKTAVGDRYVLERMLQKGYNIGGEQSGHVIFLDYATTGDGELSGVQLLKTVVKSGKKLSQLAKIMTVYPQVLINVQVTPEGKQKYNNDEYIISAVQQAEMDLMGDGRVLVRVSGTEPLVRVMLEGKDLEKITRLGNRIADVVRERLS